MSDRGQLFQGTSILKIQVCWSSTNQKTSSSSHRNVTRSHHDIADKMLLVLTMI